MKKIVCTWILCLIFILTGSIFAGAAVEIDCMRELMNAEVPMNTLYGDTAALTDILAFSIPSDWERSFEKDDEGTRRFLFRGEDEAGRSVFFLGGEADSNLLEMEVSSYTDLRNAFIETEIDSFISDLNGIGFIFSGDDNFAVGMCLTREKTLCFFGFYSENYDLSEIIQSNKLKRDMTAILHSVKIVDGEKLMSPNKSMWEETGKPEGSEAVESSRERTERERFFERVCFGTSRNFKTHPVCLGEALVIYVPDDWNEIKENDFVCAYTGMDEEGNSVTVTVDASRTEGMTIDEIKADVKGKISCCEIETNEIRYFIALTKDALITASLAGDGNVYRLTASLDSKAGMQSEKLIGDLHQIMCRLRPIHEGELEQSKAADLSANSQHSDEDPVSFLNTEFERMVCAAMDRDEEAPIYPSELAAIRSLSIRDGNLLFTPEIQYGTSYDQPSVLDLADLMLFPNLSYLDITDMMCSGFETVTELPDLRRLIMIRTGLTDCSFLSGMKLTELDLAGNELVDVTPISGVKGLKELNVSDTGADTLEFTRGMDLTMLVAADNPISNLEPISNMSGLTELYIQNTNVTSLNALRDLSELKILFIGDLRGEVSLEPLYGHEKLLQVIYWGTPASDEDRQRLKDGIW